MAGIHQAHFRKDACDNDDYTPAGHRAHATGSIAGIAHGAEQRQEGGGMSLINAVLDVASTCADADRQALLSALDDYQAAVTQVLPAESGRATPRVDRHATGGSDGTGGEE